MWEIHEKPVSRSRFASLEPVEVLYEFDVAAHFHAVLDSEGELYLAYWSDGDRDRWRYVVVPTTSNIVFSLRSGRISVYEALNQARCWVCDIDLPGDVRACYRSDFDSIPRDALPSEGIKLLPTIDLAIRSPSNGATLDFEGRVRELDKDHLTF